MRKNITGPVTIRATSYPSAAAASRALGVSRQTVISARANGTLDRCGLGLPGNLDGASNRKETRIKGATYESRLDAARALGLSLSQISTFLSVAEFLKIDVT